VSISPRLTENNQNLVDGLLANDYVSSSNKFPLENSGMATCLFFAHSKRPSTENKGCRALFFYCAEIQQALIFTANDVT